jgi:prephenate dehydrogenase
MATALFNLMHSSPAWADMGAMASSGFRDMTRLASGDPLLAHGIWLTNREAIIHWLDRMSEELLRLKGMLQDAQDEALLELMARTQMHREDFLANPPRRQIQESAGGMEPGKAVMDLLVGGMLAERLRKVQKMPELYKEKVAPTSGGKKISLSEKIAEDIRRDLEKLEQKRAAREKPGEEE